MRPPSRVLCSCAFLVVLWVVSLVVGLARVDAAELADYPAVLRFHTFLLYRLPSPAVPTSTRTSCSTA